MGLIGRPISLLNIRVPRRLKKLGTDVLPLERIGSIHNA